MSAHAAIRPRRRGRKVVAIVTALLFIPSVAFAAYMLLMGMTGSVSTVNTGYTLAGTSVKQSVSMECSTVANGDVIEIQVTNAYPGGTCDFVATYSPKAGSTEYLKAQSVSFAQNPPIDVSFLPAGILPAPYDQASCGAAATSDTDFAKVAMRLTVAESAEMGATYTAEAGAGVQFVPPADFDATACNVA